MNRQQAVALVMYLQRAHAIIPTTGAEWESVSGALSLVEAVANGTATVEVKPVKTADPSASS